jgi:ABC-2 type transport system ATP-binding protein
LILEAKNLSRWYQQVIAINDVSLSIEPGITGVLGPNGAGKTTFLRILMGLMPPSSGTIRVLGENPWRSPTVTCRMGYCPEHDGLYEWMRGRDFVEMMAGIRGIRDQKRISFALEKVQLEDVADRRIFTYSRGMRQRLKLAQAIVHDPELLILDEPLVGSDPLVRRELVSLIKNFSEEGKSVLVSSHVLHEIEAITPRIVLLHQGRLLAEGHIREIRKLIDRHPHLIRIGTSQPRELASFLVREPEVEDVHLEGERLFVKTSKPDLFYTKLPGIVLESGCSVDEVCSPDDNLEAVFRYLTEK